MRTIPGSQRGALRQAMVTRQLTGTDGRSWSEEFVHAGIFSLFGLGCSHTPASNAILSESIKAAKDPAVSSATTT